MSYHKRSLSFRSINGFEFIAIVGKSILVCVSWLKIQGHDNIYTSRQGFFLKCNYKRQWSFHFLGREINRSGSSSLIFKKSDHLSKFKNQTYMRNWFCRVQHFHQICIGKNDYPRYCVISLLFHVCMLIYVVIFWIHQYFFSRSVHFCEENLRRPSMGKSYVKKFMDSVIVNIHMYLVLH